MIRDLMTTTIVNATAQQLVMKVGRRQGFVRIGSVKIGGEYSMELDMDWTYREFRLEDERNAEKKVVVSSDECCDYERITVNESGGTLVLCKVARKLITPDLQPVESKWKLTWRFWR